jgi:hypothetical protein
MKAHENDSIYPVSTEVYEKVNPGIKLIVCDYKHRIYYCRPVGTEQPATMAFYERELSLQS